MGKRRKKHTEVIDKIQALIRTPHYLEDLKEYNSLKDESSQIKKFIEITERYKIGFLVDPNSHRWITHETFEKSSGELKDFLTEELENFWGFESPVWTISEGDRLVKNDDGKLHLDMKATLEERRYLTVKVDLTKKKKDIKGRIDELIGMWTNQKADRKRPQ
jgi:hypothetical protein